MKLATFVMVVKNRFGLSQGEVYETILKHFDVIDAIMCLDGDCLAVCRSAINCADEPTAVSDFNNLVSRDTILIVDRHDDVELLLERMYYMVDKYNEELMMVENVL